MSSLITAETNSLPQRPSLSVTTLPLYSKQEVYDHIVGHLRKQGQPAKLISDSGSGTLCVYLTPDGRKCAAGSLFTPDEYKTEYEDKPWSFLVAAKHVPDAHNLLIVRLQCVHDDLDVDSWEWAFKKVAGDFNLVYTPPEVALRKRN